MTHGLSRRDLIAMTGVGFAAAAFEQAGATAPETTSPARLTYGQCLPHGIPPTFDPDNYSEYNNKYNPQYIALVFIDFSEKWRLAINHASFGPQSLNEGNRLRKAIRILKERDILAEGSKRFKNLANNKPYLRQHDLTLDRVDFSDFGFASQNETFIYFNSNDVILNKDWLITFTQFSQDGLSRDENHSYLKARLVPHNQMEGLTGRLIRVRNYMLDKERKPIGPWQETPHQLYSMNIHFRLKSEGKEVAMVIDPDTGNGTGHEP